MSSMEDSVTIRTLKLRSPALGTRAIAGLLGISRNTVKDALASDRAPQYERAKVINPEIEPWVEFVTEGYLVKHLRVSRILADLRSKGFTGSQSALYRWIEEELKPRRVAQNAQAFQPYETKPGEQMQYDLVGVSRFDRRGNHAGVRAPGNPGLQPLQGFRRQPDGASG